MPQIILKENKLLSTTALSNLYTMQIASRYDDRQLIPNEPTIPSEAVRKLRARLILEEALETIQALGFTTLAQVPQGEPIEEIRDVVFVRTDTVDFEKLIDGCCDTVYVCVGTLISCGIPDLPHLDEVNRANNDKFPNGVGITDDNGKFQKPKNWQKPNHSEVMKSNLLSQLAQISRSLVEGNYPR